MAMPASSFLEFNLPDPATWFYLSLLLAVALFFKFSRVLSVRNWDILTLFLLVPGLLLRHIARFHHVAHDWDGRVASPGNGLAAARRLGFAAKPTATSGYDRNGHQLRRAGFWRQRNSADKFRHPHAADVRHA